MDPRDTLAALRDAKPVSEEDLKAFMKLVAQNKVSDAQIGAFAMAICINRLDQQGRTQLTRAMRDSGSVLHWADDRPVVDKHSTGGVGDCVSLVLAPALAACDVAVPMISGRGLGHTGGTLDKLAAIPGVNVDIGSQRLRRIVEKIGCVIAAASDDIAPADRRLYAVRDVSGTVESLDLICASILSKKLAAGLGTLVLDIKVGSGAFMKDIVAARALAQALVETSNNAGCRTTALISDMNQPLVPAAGNAIEVRQAMQVLTGGTRNRLTELTLALGGEVLSQCGRATNPEDGVALVSRAIESGAAAEKLSQMVAEMGGPLRFVETWERVLPEANIIHECVASKSGFVQAIDTEVFGKAVTVLGGGRRVETDQIDPSVGLSDIREIGAKVEKGQPVLRIHAARADHALTAEAMLREAIWIGENPMAAPILLHDRIGK